MNKVVLTVFVSLAVIIAFVSAEDIKAANPYQVLFEPLGKKDLCIPNRGLWCFNDDQCCSGNCHQADGGRRYCAPPGCYDGGFGCDFLDNNCCGICMMVSYFPSCV